MVKVTCKQARIAYVSWYETLQNLTENEHVHAFYLVYVQVILANNNRKF